MWLFIGRVLSGVTGASFSIASAYVADTTTPEKRAGAFGLLGAAFGLGLVIGPGLGGVLGAHGARVPLYVAAAFSLANAIYGFFALPESLPKSMRLAFSWRRANPIGALVLLRSHPELFGLAGVLVRLDPCAGVAAIHDRALCHLSVRLDGADPGHHADPRRDRTGGGAGARGAAGHPLDRKPLVDRGRPGFGAAGMVIAGTAPSGDILWLGIPVLALRAYGDRLLRRS
jgi:DHA1 family tetracycline resistance protein-like MFS transporter